MDENLGVTSVIAKIYNQVSGDHAEKTKYETYSKSSVITRIGGDSINSDISSIGTSILDIEDLNYEIPKPKNHLHRIQYLENENQRLNDQLTNEKKKSEKLEKKLQFVNDNQKIFMQLKEIYFNMKYNQTANRKIVEIQEKGTQAWDGIFCANCLETEELRRQVNEAIKRYSVVYPIFPDEMETFKNTLTHMKNLLKSREESYLINEAQLNKLEQLVATLKTENSLLKEAITIGIPFFDSERNDQIAENTIINERKLLELQNLLETTTRESEKLKKIIYKYDKRIRNLAHKKKKKYIPPVNEKENEIVHRIIRKFGDKLELRKIAKSLNEQNINLHRRPFSPLRSAHPSTKVLQ